VQQHQVDFRLPPHIDFDLWTKAFLAIAAFFQSSDAYAHLIRLPDADFSRKPLGLPFQIIGSVGFLLAFAIYDHAFFTIVFFRGNPNFRTTSRQCSFVAPPIKGLLARKKLLQKPAGRSNLQPLFFVAELKYCFRERHRCHRE
jgi:hypothetical protein